ncbi:phage baseplate plug family protein [Serratia fonticola]|uniref:phage baseplate plug family protein n=1 Tax=Serratia fonticola TaxID=47917 RepID=UPI003AAF8D65
MVSNLIEIPLTPTAQQFAIQLAGVQYQMTLIWRDAAGWVLDIANNDRTPLIQGIPLVAGADLLAQYRYLGIGGALFVVSDPNVLFPPTKDNLGIECHLYFLVE